MNKGVTEIKGDLFETDCQVIAHGVNCRNGFGSGVAGQIAKIHPFAKRLYHRKFEEEGWRLGEIQVVSDRHNNRFFMNCATQDKYGYDGEVLVNYEAVRTCMEKARDYCKKYGFTLAIPKIGCGLAGGDWKIVKDILNEVFTEMEVKVYVRE